MSVAFVRGQQLGPADLDISLENTSSYPLNAAEISYALYEVVSGQEVLMGVPRRDPVNDSVGHYYASVIIPLDANIDDYRIRWTFRETIGGAIHTVVQEFNVIDRACASNCGCYTQRESEMIHRLRILLRDNNPDRNYHFRPPAHEETIRQFNQVFGFIWEDYELQEFLYNGLDMVSAAPPRTPISNLDVLYTNYPEWRTLVLNGGMMYALFAMMVNWIADEFSLDCKTLVRVFLPDGRDVVLPIEELYSICHDE